MLERIWIDKKQVELPPINMTLEVAEAINAFSGMMASVRRLSEAQHANQIAAEKKVLEGYIESVKRQRGLDVLPADVQSALKLEENLTLAEEALKS